MEKRVQVFRSFADAEKADKEYYRSLSPAERIRILLSLIAQGEIARVMELPKDLREFIELLNALDERYLVGFGRFRVFIS